MFFLISLALSIYLGMSEIKSYGKLVPSNAITNKTKIMSVVPLLIQRVASISAASTIIEFFNKFNNWFTYFFVLIFMVIAFYFVAKAFFLVVVIFMRILKDNIDENPKKFE